MFYNCAVFANDSKTTIVSSDILKIKFLFENMKAMILYSAITWSEMGNNMNKLKRYIKTLRRSTLDPSVK